MENFNHTGRHEPILYLECWYMQWPPMTQQWYIVQLPVADIMVDRLDKTISEEKSATAG